MMREKIIQIQFYIFSCYTFIMSIVNYFIVIYPRVLKNFVTLRYLPLFDTLESAHIDIPESQSKLFSFIASALLQYEVLNT